MSGLQALLASYAHTAQRAQRKTSFRHRRLVETPITVVPWQLGGEPFALAAVAFGQRPGVFDLLAPGQPLNRELAFESVLPFAKYFNAVFEEPWQRRTPALRGTRNPRVKMMAPEAPQVLVPNRGGIKLLERIGRRLAYLPLEQLPGGPPPAAPELVRLGRHLQFLTRHYLHPGQQVILDAVSLCGDNWVTVQNDLERQSLPAIDAWIEPPAGVSGYEAARVAERISVGPIPNPDDERLLATLMEEFDRARAGGNAQLAASTLELIVDHYRRLSAQAWEVTWRVYERESRWAEEPRYVDRRVDVDVEAYSDHMNWLLGPAAGRRRTRETVRQAIRARRSAESATSRVSAEETTADELLMIPFLLDHKAIEGEVIAFDGAHSEVKVGNQRASAAPIVVVRTQFPSYVAVGKDLWWTVEPSRVRAVVDDVRPDLAGLGSIVRLKIMQGAGACGSLRTDPSACFSILSTNTFDFAPVPPDDPFTHIAPETGSPDHIEPEGDGVVEHGAGGLV